MTRRNYLTRDLKLESQRRAEAVRKMSPVERKKYLAGRKRAKLARAEQLSTADKRPGAVYL